MEIYRGLNKYGFNPNIKQLEKYNLVNSHDKLFKKYGISLKIKNEYDLQLALVYYNAFLNKERFSQIYQRLLNECHGLWETMDYRQRQILISGELEMILNEIPHIYSNDKLILIPFFNEEINVHYNEDYQSLLLKKNRYLLEDFSKEIHNPIDLYGQDSFLNGFSDFKLIKQIKDLSYFYLADYKAIYIFNHKTNVFALKIIIVSKDVDICVMDSDLEKIVDLMINNNARGLADYLFERGYLSNKVYQCLIRKYIGG